MNKKAQMEVLGLAIVVVLILVATIFIIRFFVFKTSTDYRKGFVSTELASNMLSTFLSTNAEDCYQMTMTELLQNCALYGFGGKCVDEGVTYGCTQCSNQEYSCEFIKSSATSIFQETLDKWSIRYILLAYIDINSPFIQIIDPISTSKGLQCPEKKSKLFPVPVDPTSAITMFVNLDICQ
jgi:hypothetical protein